MTGFEKFEAKANTWKARRDYRKQNGNSHIWAGVFIVLVGITLLLPVPGWVISWPMLLLALGLFMGLRHQFRGVAWFVMMLIGGVFLAGKIDPSLSLNQYIWPIVLISVGLLFIFRPRKRRCWIEEHNNANADTGEPVTGNTAEEKQFSQEDFIDSTSIFGGIKKNVVSKNFRGGDIVNVFGGSEINLQQADINGSVELEITQVFGGTKLIIPSDWELKSEIVAIFGGIEDKRDLAGPTNPEKVVVLRGTSIFAGIEIKNF